MNQVALTQTMPVLDLVQRLQKLVHHLLVQECCQQQKGELMEMEITPWDLARVERKHRSLQLQMRHWLSFACNRRWPLYHLGNFERMLCVAGHNLLWRE